MHYRFCLKAQNGFRQGRVTYKKKKLVPHYWEPGILVFSGYFASEVRKIKQTLYWRPWVMKLVCSLLARSNFIYSDPSLLLQAGEDQYKSLRDETTRKG